MDIRSVAVRVSDGVNVVIGQAHFIKTLEDLAEAVCTTVPQGKYGLAFNEASGPRLVRAEGNDASLKASAVEHARAIGAGHLFVLLLRDCYPINVLGRVKDCAEVCSVFCATSNPVEVIVAETDQGRGVLGVIDGQPPQGVETDTDVAARKQFLRAIGYKL